MTLLILGLLLWMAGHFFKRLFPAQRAALGSKGRAVMGVVLLSAVLLMIFGYSLTEFIPVWDPPSWLRGVNNLLMLLAFYVYGASAAKPARVWIATKIRHPQLTGFSIWATAHLLVNGDLAAIILFGGLLIWAVLSIRLINAAEGPWTQPEQAPAKKEITLVIVTLVLFTVVSLIHLWLGVNPFGA